MATAAKKEPPVQEVRNVGLEERLDKVISLIEGQNKAWQRCLTLLTEMNTLLFEKYKASDLLLEEHPPVKAPPPSTVGGSPQPQPFNNYSDSVPYGTGLEAEREAPPESFPAGPVAPPATYNDEPIFSDIDITSSASFAFTMKGFSQTTELFGFKDFFTNS